MREFFYPDSIAVFGVAANPLNLGKNIVANCVEKGFQGEIFPVGKDGGSVCGKEIITDGESLPMGIDLAVILVPARIVPELLDLCGRKGIRHAIVSTGGYREFSVENNKDEENLLLAARRYGIRFIGPNCIGVMCMNSGLCTTFNPMGSTDLKKGGVSIIAQSGGIATQLSYSFSDEHVGFSKIISAGNKLDLNEVDLAEYLVEDDDTEQIHLYLESIENGRQLMELARRSTKPFVVFKSNVSATASEVAKSHTAALSNNDSVVEGAFRQAGIVRATNLEDMPVFAKAFSLPPLRGERLAVISLSGGFSVIMGDAIEKYGFRCPPLPRSLVDKIESYRRGGVIRISNPMDLGDVYDIRGLIFAVKHSLALDEIDGMVLSLIYGPEVAKLWGAEGDFRETMLGMVKKISHEIGKPIALSFFTEKKYVEGFKMLATFPVFDDAIESVRALRMLRDYWSKRI
jgi:acetate---CoA ligase (ADP-forming)